MITCRSMALAVLMSFTLGAPMFAADSSSARRPNVLFLFMDDMQADSIAALGNRAIKTPILDGLVQRGFVLSNAYCLGGNMPAVCTPSRNMLLSGKAFFRWKGPLAPGDAPNFPLSMQDAGYQTYHHGKKGNTAINIQAKFEINKYVNEDVERTSGEPGKLVVDDAIEFLKERTKDRPFCMYLAFGNPHDPRAAAEKHMNQYQRDEIPLPKNFLAQHPFDNGEMTVRDEKLARWPRTETEIRRQLHEYYAVMTALDAHIGRLLQTLKDLRIEDNTLIIFSADQGVALGSHGLLGKQNLYDCSMKAPLFFAGPGIPAGRSDALVYLLDIYPTVCDLVGASIPTGIDGRSFKSVITGQGKSARRELFLAYRDVQRAWRDDRWKLIRYPQVNVTQLFDLAADPDEIHNLAAESDQQQRVEQMLARLKAAQSTFGDTLPLSVENPRPAAWIAPAGNESTSETKKKQKS
jgi:arylsulfatase A-like enzyme